MRQTFHPMGALIIAAGFLASLLLVHRVAGLSYLLLLFLIIASFSGLRWSALSKGILRVWPLIVLTLGLHLFLGNGLSIDFANPPQSHANYVKMQTAFLFTGRLVLIISVSVALFALYTPGRMAREMGRWFAVLPAGRKTAAQTELLITLALRFVPLMGQEYQRLQLALAARGEVASGRLAKLRHWRQIMYPLMINAFRRADHVAIALQARGYDPAVVRTNYSYRHMSVREWASALTVVALVFAAPWL